MPEMHLRQAKLTYSTCGSFSEKKETTKNLKKLEIKDIFIKSN